MVLAVKCLICNKELTYTQSDPSELIHHIKTEHPLHINCKKTTADSRRRKESSQYDLDKSLRRNTESLNSVIDKEAQTDINWKYFEKMSYQYVDTNRSKPGMSKKSEESSANEETQNMTVIDKVIEKIPKSSPGARRINEMTPLKTQVTPKQRKDKSNVHVEAVGGKNGKVLFTEGASYKPPERRQDPRRAKYYKTSIEKWRPVGDEKIHCPQCQSLTRPIVRTHTERVTRSSLASSLVMTCWPMCFAPCLFPAPTHEKLHCPVCNYYLGVYDHQKKITQSNPEVK